MESDITIEHEQDISKSKVYDNREDFLEEPIRFSGNRPGYGNKSEVDYYYGPEAVTDHNEKVKQELDGELDTMTGEFAGSEILGNALSLGGSKVNFFGNLFMSAGQHAADKKDKEDRLKWKNQEGPANKFSMEMQVNRRDALDHSEDKQIKLHPTDETYEKIERWKAIHREEPDFPYDGEAITKQNWQEMYELFYDRDGDGSEKLNIDDKYTELYDYMKYGPQENKNIENLDSTVKELMNEKYKDN